MNEYTSERRRTEMINMTKRIGAVMLSSACTLPVSGQNLLQNPSFENVLPPLVGGGPASWARFNNMNIDEPPDNQITAFDQERSIVSVGEFLGEGSQSDNGLIQTVDVPNAAGRCFRTSVYTLSPSTDFLQPFTPDEASRGHFPLLFMDFKDSSGNVISSVGTQVFDASEDPADTWIRTSVQAVAPTGTEEITIFMLFIQFDNAEGLLFWDLASIQDVATISCPADWNDDGVLNAADVNDLLSDADDDSRPVDYNCDGIGDFFDVLTLQDDLEMGCP